MRVPVFTPSPAAGEDHPDVWLGPEGIEVVVRADEMETRARSSRGHFYLTSHGGVRKGRKGGEYGSDGSGGNLTRRVGATPSMMHVLVFPYLQLMTEHALTTYYCCWVRIIAVVRKRTLGLCIILPYMNRLSWTSEMCSMVASESLREVPE